MRADRAKGREEGAMTTDDEPSDKQLEPSLNFRVIGTGPKKLEAMHENTKLAISNRASKQS